VVVIIVFDEVTLLDVAGSDSARSQLASGAGKAGKYWGARNLFTASARRHGPWVQAEDLHGG
jgi:hypothetical protein